MTGFPTEGGDRDPGRLRGTEQRGPCRRRDQRSLQMVGVDKGLADRRGTEGTEVPADRGDRDP